MTKTIPFIALLLISCFCGVDMMLTPLSDLVACPGGEITFFCNVTMTRLRWIWQDATNTGAQNYAGIEGAVKNKTSELNGVPGVSTTLLDYRINGSTAIFVTSLLQFTPSDEFINTNITCNNDSRLVKIKGCSEIIQSFNISRLHNSAKYTVVYLEWDAIRNDSINITLQDIDSNHTVDDIWTNDKFISFNLLHNTVHSIQFETINCEKMCLVANGNIDIQKCDLHTFITSQIFSASKRDNLQVTYKCTNILTPNNKVDEGSCIQINFRRSVINCTKNEYCESLSADMHELIIRYIDGSNISYKCIDGFQPTTEITAYCNSSGFWIPDPRNHICTEIPPSTKETTTWSIEVVGGFVSAVIVILLIVIILLIIIILIKNIRKDKNAAREKSIPQMELEYDRIKFYRTTPDNEAESSEYGKLNTRCNNHSYLVPDEEEYSTLNKPIIMKKNLVRDDYDYTSIKITDAQKSKAVYAELEKDADCESSLDRSCVSKVNYSTIKPIHPADSLLNLDTMLIQLRQIASKWESLGIHLNYSASTLLELKKTANGSDFNCLVELCDKWLRDVYNPTWKMIAHALKEIGEDKLSIEILQIYDTGELPDRQQEHLKQNFMSGVVEDQDAPPVPPQCF